MGQLWEWTGVDVFGKPIVYQTDGPDVPESGMLAHLRTYYRNLNITAIRRIEPGEVKPQTRAVETHIYDFGILRAVRRELGLVPDDQSASILERMKAQAKRNARTVRPLTLRSDYVRPPSLLAR